MRNILIANEGKVLTNGEIYGKVIYLAEDANGDEFYEISAEEYARLVELTNDENSI